MDNNNENPSTGNKGVFPGSAPQAPQQPVQHQIQQPIAQHTGHQNTAPQQPQTETKVFSERPVDEDASTYIRLETNNTEGEVSGVLEIDLISFRERGIESRYLSINTVGMGLDNSQTNTVISIDNEADFLRFKNFVSKLNWND